MSLLTDFLLYYYILSQKQGVEKNGCKNTKKKKKILL